MKDFNYCKSEVFSDKGQNMKKTCENEVTNIKINVLENSTNNTYECSDFKMIFYV